MEVLAAVGTDMRWLRTYFVYDNMTVQHLHRLMGLGPVSATKKHAILPWRAGVLSPRCWRCREERAGGGVL